MSGMNVERNMYKYLMEVMERLDQAERKLKEEKAERKLEVETLCKEHREEIRQLKEQHNTMLIWPLGNIPLIHFLFSLNDSLNVLHDH